MQQAGLQFTVRAEGQTDESYPSDLQAEEIPLFLAEQKAKAFLASSKISDNTILITADTIVWHNGKSLDKPTNTRQAVETLEELSACMHHVYTSVCLTTNNKQITFYDHTKVFFKKLSHQEIMFYVNNYNPYDKAGGYGIQDWIGLVGIEKIEGSFQNVVGLPIGKLYSHLQNFTVLL
jgi:septum formation protein